MEQSPSETDTVSACQEICHVIILKPISVFIRASLWALPWARWHHCTLSNITSPISIL